MFSKSTAADLLYGGNFRVEDLLYVEKGCRFAVCGEGLQICCMWRRVADLLYVGKGCRFAVCGEGLIKLVYLLITLNR